MNNNLKNYYNNIIVYDLITKGQFKNIFEIPKIKKICLNVGFKKASIDKKKLINIIVLLKLLTNQQPSVTKSKKNNIFLKIKKNSIVGCKVTLRSKNIYFFLEKLIFFIIPNIKTIKFNTKNEKILNFQIKNILNFYEFKKEFIKFKDIPPLDISIHSNTKNFNNLYTLLNSFYIFNK